MTTIARHNQPCQVRIIVDIGLIELYCGEFTLYTFESYERRPADYTVWDFITAHRFVPVKLHT